MKRSERVTLRSLRRFLYTYLLKRDSLDGTLASSIAACVLPMMSISWAKLAERDQRYISAN